MLKNSSTLQSKAVASGDLAQDMRGLAENMQRGQLTADQIADHREIFREMIISTCYVIENMMPMVGGLSAN